MGKPKTKKYNDASIKHRDTATWTRIRQRLTAVKLMCSDGATNAQIADYLGVSIYTIVTYRKRYPEFDECFKRGRGEVVKKLENKMYQLAMGVVDTDITRVVTKEITEEVEDADTGAVDEVTHTKVIKTNIKESGRGTPDSNAIQFMLRNLAPEKYNVQQVDTSTDIEPIKVVDDVATTEVSGTPQLFYDDSQDSNEGVKDDDENG